MDYLRRFLVPSCKIDAYLNMWPLNFMVHGFTDIMKKTCSFCHHDISAKFSCHTCCEISYFDGVFQHILPKTGSESQSSKQANKIRVKAVNSHFNSSAFPFFFYYIINFFLCLLYHLFNSGRMNPPIIYELL